MPSNHPSRTAAALGAALLCAGAFAAPVPMTEAQAERYDAAVRDAGNALNSHLDACRAEARNHPKASARDLKACEHDARLAFRQDMRKARAARRQKP